MILAALKDPVVSQDSQNGILTASFAEENPLSILVAEDNFINQKLAERILLRLGYKIDIVSDGKQVLDALRRKTYNVILMDVRMPEMDGFEATMKVRQMAIEQPYIIAMTANAMPEDKEECLNMGMNNYIAKPMQMPEITNILKNIAFIRAV